MESLNYIVGEKKYITTKVKPVNKSETIVIISATYKVVKEDSTVATSGSYDVSGDTISFLYNATEQGIFTLQTTVKVGAEEIKDYCKIIVKG